jgi:uncharacterized membrane protein YesL
MAARAYPETFFGARRQVLTQEPMAIVQTEPQTVVINTNALIVLGIISIVALLAFFAYLASSDKKCKC